MCGSRKSLQVHHIIEYAKSKALREELSNICTLCWSCHKSIKGKESHYVTFFHNIIKNK